MCDVVFLWLETLTSIYLTNWVGVWCWRMGIHWWLKKFCRDSLTSLAISMHGGSNRENPRAPRNPRAQRALRSSEAAFRLTPSRQGNLMLLGDRCGQIILKWENDVVGKFFLEKKHMLLLNCPLKSQKRTWRCRDMISRRANYVMGNVKMKTKPCCWKALRSTMLWSEK